MYKLVMNENVKIYRRRSSIIMIIVLMAFTILASLIIRLNMGIPETASVWDSVKSLLGLTFFIKIFTVVIAGGIVANEFTWGTIKLLLIRPISRSRILLSKYIAVIIFSIMLMMVLFVTSLVSNTLFYGWDRLFTASSHSIILTFELYMLKYAEVFVYGTLAFMLSVLTRNSAFAIGFTLVTMFLGPIVTYYVSDYPWARYILFTNIDLTIYAVNNHAQLGGISLPFSLSILIVYCSSFNAAAWLFFNNQEIN